MGQSLEQLLNARTGHFLLESGHHGDLWLDLDQLFHSPMLLAPFVLELAALLKPIRAEAICGPMTGGALLAQWLARELEVEFAFAERIVMSRDVCYRLPSAIRTSVVRKRVVVVDDVINAGSAVRKTIVALKECGAAIVGIGALLVLGNSGPAIASELSLPLRCIEQRPNNIWKPGDCPLCAAGEVLENAS